MSIQNPDKTEEISSLLEETEAYLKDKSKELIDLKASPQALNRVKNALHLVTVSESEPSLFLQETTGFKGMTRAAYQQGVNKDTGLRLPFG